THPIGGCAIDAHGTALPDQTLEAARQSAAVLLGAVGGPKWDDPRATVRPEQGLLGIRRALGLYANLRPERVPPARREASPLTSDRLHGVDLVVTENLFGDILTDEAAALAGSLGLCPSASLGEGTRGLYEPIHGSAPDIAGRGLANPIGTILSAAMLLRHSLSLPEEAAAVERAVDGAIADGLRTADLGGTLKTRDLGDAIRA